MTGKTLRNSQLLATTPAAQLQADRLAVAVRLGELEIKPPSGTPYPGVAFADVVAAANPRKRPRTRTKPRSDDA